MCVISEQSKTCLQTLHEGTLLAALPPVSDWICKCVIPAASLFASHGLHPVGHLLLLMHRRVYRVFERR